MNIAIVFGGKSVEHDVSIVTAKQIYNISKSMYNIKLVYVDKQGNFNLYTNSKFDFVDFKTTNKNLVPITFNNGSIYKKSVFGFKKQDKIDCAIMCTHGGNGENGTITSYLISCGIPVTAGSSLALGISMNKWLSKQFFKANNMPFVKGLYADKNTDIDILNKKIEKSFGYPVIVKANGGGSSIGIKTATNKQELINALKVALEFDYSAVVEQELTDFTEYNCAVFGDEQNMQISNIDEPIRQQEILSFADKYLHGGGKNKKGSLKTQARVYPNMQEDLKQKIQKIAKQIFVKLGFYGVVRIDFIYCTKTNKIYVNEINAIPGSLANYYFATTLLQQNLFIEKLVQIGIKNYQKTTNININYITKLF